MIIQHFKLVYQSRMNFQALLFLFGVMAVAFGQPPACPSASVISPCTCVLNGNDVDITCASLSSLRALTDVFSRTFPTNTLHSVVVTRSDLGPLPDNVFNGKSFQKISFLENRLTTYTNAAIFSSSQARLTSLIVNQDTGTWNFNTANINDYNALTELELTGFNLTVSGAISSTSLTSLTLRSDFLTSFPTLGSLPALKILNMDGSAIESLSISLTSLTSLNEVYFGHNKIKALAITVPRTVVLADFSTNLIETLQMNWIQGTLVIFSYVIFG